MSRARCGATNYSLKYVLPGTCHLKVENGYAGPPGKYARGEVIRVPHWATGDGNYYMSIPEGLNRRRERARSPFPE